jgi:hypothetical protein
VNIAVCFHFCVNDATRKPRARHHSTRTREKRGSAFCPLNDVLAHPGPWPGRSYGRAGKWGKGAACGSAAKRRTTRKKPHPFKRTKDRQAGVPFLIEGQKHDLKVSLQSQPVEQRERKEKLLHILEFAKKEVVLPGEILVGADFPKRDEYVAGTRGVKGVKAAAIDS